MATPPTTLGEDRTGSHADVPPRIGRRPVKEPADLSAWHTAPIMFATRRTRSIPCSFPLALIKTIDRQDVRLKR